MLFLFLVSVTAVVLISAITLLIESLAASWGTGRQQDSHDFLPESTSLAVLMPAHDEEVGISQTLCALLPQLRHHDRVLVVADNCTDRTAEVAREMGATVIERHDSEKRGKGYALDFGLRYLESNPPDIVVVVDADCVVQPGGIYTLAAQAISQQAPVQALYLMEALPQSSVKDSISAFAFRVKNLVRPLGLKNLKQPCMLMGTGMAFPWTTVTGVSFANGHIAEDMKLGLDLAIAGFAPRYCPQVMVTSRLPTEESAAQTQRKRWEHGHLQLILEYLPRLIYQGIRQRRFDLFVLAADLSIPPLSLELVLWAMLTAASVIFAFLTGNIGPLVLSVISGMSIVMAVVLAWYSHGRRVLSLKDLLHIPFYLLWKLPLYTQFVTKPETQWIRTARDNP